MISENPIYDINLKTHVLSESFKVGSQRIRFVGYQADIGYGMLTYGNKKQVHDDLSIIFSPSTLSITGYPEEDSNINIKALYQNGNCFEGLVSRLGYDFFGSSFLYGFTISTDMGIRPFIRDANTNKKYDSNTFRFTHTKTNGKDEWEIYTGMNLSKIHIHRQGVSWHILGGEMKSPIVVNFHATEHIVRQAQNDLQLFLEGVTGIDTVAFDLEELWMSLVGEKV